MGLRVKPAMTKRFLGSSTKNHITHLINNKELYYEYKKNKNNIIGAADAV